MDGASFRSLGNEYGISPAQSYVRVLNELNQLPENTWVTKEYCNRWSGRLVVDGKFVKVKGYEQKIPFVYGIDFLTHDIPLGMLFPSENEEAFAKFFSILKYCHYPLQIVISDDANGLISGLKRVYPNARRQLCQNHYVETIRQQLKIRTEETYRSFFFALHDVFNGNYHHFKREALFRRLWHTYAKHDPILEAILVDVLKRYDELFAYDNKMTHCPRTTNIIESYNSHLNGRLKTIKGFQSFHSATRWLNAWMIHRRTKPFTDCDKPFKHLNGKTSLEMSIKKQTDWPAIPELQAPKTKR